MPDIQSVADRLTLPAAAREPRLNGVLKIDSELVDQPERGRVVLVTAMTPTPAGEGKTTTVIGLVDALRLRGVRVVGALREPSLGPLFGMKGGAIGGGRARVEPGDAINLHFTGDIHAVTAAHDLLAAITDNHLFQGGAPEIASVKWGRVLDMNDRSLREVDVGFAAKKVYRGRFDITASSEVMAVLSLARDVPDLRARLGRIVVATTPDGAPVTADDLKAGGAMAAVLLDAVRPNLVQTLEGTPVFIHGGPFGNVAQGTSSLLQTRLCRKLADVVVTEAGFAFDLGGFKFVDLKCRAGDLRPAAVVMVATIRAMRYHGGNADFTKVDVAAVGRGVQNVVAHVEAMGRIGLPAPIVALNRFPDDDAHEIATARAACEAAGATFVEARHFAEGGAGALALADAVRAHLSATPEDSPGLRPVYDVDEPVVDKIEQIARVVLGARDVRFTDAAAADIAGIETMGLANLPICLAKTHLSISDDQKVRGRPGPFTLTITGVRAAAGPGFLVARCGPILTMPGLPARPAAEHIDVERGEDGRWRVRGLR